MPSCGKFVTRLSRRVVVTSLGAVVVTLAPLLSGPTASATHGGAWHVVERVSVSTAGAEGNADSRWPDTSDDGRYVAFVSSASNLVPDDTNEKRDVFRRDRGPISPPCPWDLDGDGTVGIGDLLSLFAVWGPCPGPPGCPGDFNEDGTVGVGDMLLMFANWGPCP